ncbi:MAG: hypothetical protein AB2L20_22490 [Mangrovibacterium sp.]
MGKYLKCFLVVIAFDIEKVQLIIANKSDKLNHNWGGPGIIDDISCGNAFVPKENHLLKKGNYISGWEFSYEIKAYVASETFKNAIPKSPKKKKELEKLANSLNENDNPVLMLVKLKE